jgi:hypothetical protein
MSMDTTLVAVIALLAIVALVGLVLLRKHASVRLILAKLSLGADRPGAASVEKARSGGAITADNKVGGDATVRKVDAKGDVQARTSRPKTGGVDPKG